jgi:hypothetical protein
LLSRELLRRDEGYDSSVNGTRAMPKKKTLVGSPWTKEDVRELRAHSKARTPVAEVAKAMNRRRGATEGKDDQHRSRSPALTTATQTFRLHGLQLLRVRSLVSIETAGQLVRLSRSLSEDAELGLIHVTLRPRTAGFERTPFNIGREERQRSARRGSFLRSSEPREPTSGTFEFRDCDAASLPITRIL